MHIYSDRCTDDKSKTSLCFQNVEGEHAATCIWPVATLNGHALSTFVPRMDIP